MRCGRHEGPCLVLSKDDALREQVLARRYRYRPAEPKKLLCEVTFEDNRGLLEPCYARVMELGRIPEADEYADYDAVASKFGSTRRAFALIRRVTRSPHWAEIRGQRASDLLVYFALSRFEKRPPLKKLPATLRRDIKELLGNYRRACERADALLFRAGEACRQSTIGKLLPNALYVHRSALDRLEPILRVYEGCARAYLGEVDEANVIKLHRFSGKMSYLVYPGFDSEAHPVLARSLKLSLRTLQLDCYDYATTAVYPGGVFGTFFLDTHLSAGTDLRARPAT